LLSCNESWNWKSGFNCDCCCRYEALPMNQCYKRCKRVTISSPKLLEILFCFDRIREQRNFDVSTRWSNTRLVWIDSSQSVHQLFGRVFLRENWMRWWWWWWWWKRWSSCCSWCSCRHFFDLLLHNFHGFSKIIFTQIIMGFWIKKSCYLNKEIFYFS